MLAHAYQFLSTPFTTSLNLITVDGYSLEDTRNVLLGCGYGKIVAWLLFDEINKLVNTDVDMLDFVAVNPQYNPLKYQPDGLHTTRKERDLMAAKASDNSDDYGMDWTSMPSLSQLPPVIDGTSSPATLNPPLSSPSDVIESSEPLQPAINTVPSAEDLAHLDTVAPSLIPTLILASTSTSASAAASAYSSASSSNPLPLHNVEVMVYQYDRFFGYGYWMTSIPTITYILIFVVYFWGTVIFELVAMPTNWEIQSTPKI